MRDDPASATIDELVHRGAAARQVGDQELVAVLGPSGAGKTTLFRCVTGIIRPDSGRVWFDGTDMAA